MRVRPPVRRRQRYRHHRRRIFKHRQNTRTVLYSLIRLLCSTSSSPGKTNIIIPRASTRFSSPPTVNGAKVCTNVGARADPDTGAGRLSQSHPKLQWVRELAIFCKRSRSKSSGVFISIFDYSRDETILYFISLTQISDAIVLVIII